MLAQCWLNRTRRPSMASEKGLTAAEDGFGRSSSTDAPVTLATAGGGWRRQAAAGGGGRRRKKKNLSGGTQQQKEIMDGRTRTYF